MVFFEIQPAEKKKCYNFFLRQKKAKWELEIKASFKVAIHII